MFNDLVFGKITTNPADRFSGVRLWMEPRITVKAGKSVISEYRLIILQLLGKYYI